MNAPSPTLTSRTIASAPAAIFFDMMLAAISEIWSTVAVTSRSPYRRLSAGARAAPRPEIERVAAPHHRVRQRVRLGARQPAEVDGHAEGGHLVVRNLVACVRQHEL